jgi:ketosteroid isomerase-like protein
MSEENVEIVRSILANWARGDYSSIDWAHPDIEFVQPLDRVEARGLEALGCRWREFLSAWDHFATVPEQFIDLGDDRVLVLMRKPSPSHGVFIVTVTEDASPRVDAV